MLSYYTIFMYLIFSWLLAIFFGGKNEIYTKSNKIEGRKMAFFALPPLVIGFYFCALRPFDAGGDTVPYIYAFSKISSPASAVVDAGYGTEFLFWPFQAVIKFFLNVRGWLIVNYLIVACLTYAAYERVTRRSKLSPLLFAVVFVTFFAVYAGNAMRQVYTIPLVLMAFYYCYNKEYGKFFIFYLLAVCFHWSAAVFIVIPLFVRVKNNTGVYVILPMLALATSSFSASIMDILVSITGFDWLFNKVGLYFKGGRESHIDAVWNTMNFWLCILMYIGLVLIKNERTELSSLITKFCLMSISLMFFSIHSPDVSERYMVYFLFVTPLVMAVILSGLNTSKVLKGSAYSIFFCAMAILVFTRESAKITLGI